MVEIWKPVVGYEWGYEVSNRGNVRSIDRIITQKTRWGGWSDRHMTGVMLAQHISKDPMCYGRKSVAVAPKGLGKKFQKTRLVHQLVLEAFVGPRPQGMECRHKSGDAGDNNLENLEYGTPLENSGDKYRHGTVLVGDRATNRKISAEQVAEIRMMSRSQKGADIAKQYGISQAQVSRIRNGTRWVKSGE